MTTLLRVPCSQPACTHGSNIPEPLVDAYLCGNTAVCGCHPEPLRALGVRALPCKGAVA